LSNFERTAVLIQKVTSPTHILGGQASMQIHTTGRLPFPSKAVTFGSAKLYQFSVPNKRKTQPSAPAQDPLEFKLEQAKAKYAPDPLAHRYADAEVRMLQKPVTTENLLDFTEPLLAGRKQSPNAEINKTLDRALDILGLFVTRSEPRYQTAQNQLFALAGLIQPSKNLEQSWLFFARAIRDISAMKAKAKAPGGLSKVDAVLGKEFLDRLADYGYRFQTSKELALSAAMAKGLPKALGGNETRNLDELTAMKEMLATANLGKRHVAVGKVVRQIMTAFDQLPKKLDRRV
jgi:hypothetical protein